MKNPPRLLRRVIQSRLRDLAQAGDYATWREVATELDRLEGGETWKQDDTSEDYDYLLIQERLQQMRQLRRQGDARRLTFDLYEGLHGNLANISNPVLYSVARLGTKKLVEEYLHEVVRCLDFICAGDFPDFGFEDKVEFFRRTAAAFGRSALMLSGGGTLGLFHLGVIKALNSQGLLPRVMSGASAGSIIASAVAVRQDHEIAALFEPGGLNLEAFQVLGWRERLKGGAMMDSAQLERCLEQNIGGLTFAEAFTRSRRIVSITVSPAEPHQQGRLLNYLTAPHVLLKRAVLASCAVPGVFAPVQLQARDYDGQLVPYMPSKRWVDGTLSSDLPMLRLARLHNVNHYIVSQTNPHVVPFLREEEHLRRGFAPLAQELVKSGSGGAVRLVRKYLDPNGSGKLLRQLDGIMRQRYSGDINIFPAAQPRRMLRIFSNPSDADIQAYIRDGERATWPKLERIRLQTQISRAFEDCIRLLREREHELLQPARKRKAQRSAG